MDDEINQHIFNALSDEQKKLYEPVYKFRAIEGTVTNECGKDLYDKFNSEYKEYIVTEIVYRRLSE